MAQEVSIARLAYGPMVLIAVEQHTPPVQRIVHDAQARRILPRRSRLVVAACRSRTIRNLIIQGAEREVPGIWGGTLCRKRYLDDQVAAGLATGIRQVVVLGAGVDTTATRLVAPAGGTAFVVDLPENITYTRERLSVLFGKTPERIALVPVDFAKDDLATALSAHGFQLGQPALFVLEEHTQYRGNDSVRQTMDLLAKATDGSQLVLTYAPHEVVASGRFSEEERSGQTDLIKHPGYRYGIAAEHVVARLWTMGWAEREQIGPAELTARYVAPTGRDLAVYALERSVSAQKP